MGDHQVLMAPSNNINITRTHSNPNSKVHVDGSDEKKARPHVNCPRCNSSNTKFCYYNNYSLTQPRYFCKNCRRYWTEGGSLRNVPVGGGSRKNKRAPINVISSSKSIVSELNAPSISTFASSTLQKGQDLSLSFPTSYMHAKSQNDDDIYGAAQPSIQNPSFVVPGGFAFQELKPSGSTIGFGIDGIGINGAHNHRFSGYNMLFPFEGDQNKWQGNNNNNNNNNNENSNNNNNNNPSGYWSGLLGGGSW